MADNRYNIVLEGSFSKLGDICIDDISDLCLVQSELDKLYYNDFKLEILNIQNNIITVRMIIYYRNWYSGIWHLRFLAAYAEGPADLKFC
jgi:hypothetical protein